MPLDRARDIGLYNGGGRTGTHNAITDVPGVRVGHRTILDLPRVRTGVTAIRFGEVSPARPLPAGLSVGNGYGKLIGATQVAELGQVEAPIVLTATLSAFRAADALVSWMLERPGNEQVRSLNPVVGECNDSVLSDIRSRPVRAEHVWEALEGADDGEVAQGSVGAGAGMVALGFKAGIGTASRVVADDDGSEHVLGALVLANFAGVLRADGREIFPPASRVGTASPGTASPGAIPPAGGDPDASRQAPDVGSCVVVLATSAPLDARQLSRLAARAVFALGRVGASFTHGSGDYAIAVSTTTGQVPPPDHTLNPWFTAALDATEESVLNALAAAEPVQATDGRWIPALRDTLH